MAKLVAHGSTQSRARRPLPEGWHPQVIRRSGVSEVWEVDGREHGINCTWVLDQGGPILGFTAQTNRQSIPVLRYVNYAIKKGLWGPGSVASKLEYETADLLCEILEKYLTDLSGDLAVRWFANGSDSCDAAVRIARAATRRKKFVSIGYHGSSVLFAHKPQNKGVPKAITDDRIDLEWGDLEGLNAVEDKIACVIVEVPSVDDDAATILKKYKWFCHDNDAIFIMDEMVTGFRLALGGAAEHYSIEPDMACYGKALGNGRGISALVGWPKLMNLLEDKVFYSNTFNGDPLNLAFVKGTLLHLANQGDAVYSYIWKLGENLRTAMNDAGVKMIGHAPRMDMKFSSEKKRRNFCAEMVRKGIVVDRPYYVSTAHNDSHVELTAGLAREVLG